MLLEDCEKIKQIFFVLISWQKTLPLFSLQSLSLSHTHTRLLSTSVILNLLEFAAHLFDKISLMVQVGLVIRGRYVPLLWTTNTEFADRKTHFD